MLLKQQIAASKKLSKMNIQMPYGPFQFSTLWCRTAYNTNETWTKKQHRHTFFELHYCIDGSCIYQIDNEEVTLTSNHILLLAPKLRHQILLPSSDFAEMVMGFSMRVDASNTEAVHMQSILQATDGSRIFSSTNRMRDYVRHMLELSQIQAPFISNSLALLAQLILQDIARSMEPLYELPHNTNSVRGPDPRLQSIHKFIQDNIYRALDTAKVANHFNISAKQLSRIVKASTGLTLSQIIEQQKVSAIKQLLEHTDLSLYEIAVKVGCSNEYNMNRFFKRVEGMPPGKYRLALKK